MLAAMARSKVQVRFLSAEDETLLGQVELASEQLPASFAARTTLEFGGRPWEVVKAEPMTRDEFGKTGRLTLLLRKLDVRRVSLEKIRYSLPTICDVLPAERSGSTKTNKNVLDLHRDDWRQLELVSRGLADVVARELAEVRRILDSRVGVGFEEIHVRRQPTSPLVDCHLTIASIADALLNARFYDGVSFADLAGVIDGGFALEADGLRVYGLADDGVVTTCGALRVPDALDSPLADLAGEHGLLLVDWCAGKIL
jgi:hypothetical protein